MGTEPHQGVGGRDRPHVRVVEGVRPVADLGQLLDPDDPAREEDVDGVQVAGVESVVRLGDRHGSNIPRSSATLHRIRVFSQPIGSTPGMSGWNETLML